MGKKIDGATKGILITILVVVCLISLLVYRRISINVAIKEKKESIFTEWFGERSEYESDPISAELYPLMIEWQEGGVNALINNNENFCLDETVTKSQIVQAFDDEFEKLVDYSGRLNDDQIVLARKMVYGDPTLDFLEIDYGDFIECICVLNSIYGEINDGGNYGSVHSLWDSRVAQYRHQHREDNN